MSNNLQSGHSIFTRLLLFVIVVSFCLWGIGDIFRSSGGPGVVAKVGNASVSMQDFKRSYKAQQDELRSKMGKNFTPELAKKLGLERRVLDGIISRTALEQEAAMLGIIPSEENVLDTLAHSEAFLDGDGKFNKDIFIATLRDSNMTEQQYLGDIKRQLGAQILLGTVTGNIPVAEEVVQALHKIRNEKRQVSLLFIPANAVHGATSATEEETKTYYDANIQQFTVPEYRKVTFVELTPEAYQTLANVSDEEVQKTYMERAEEYFQTERRAIEQLLYEKKEDAVAAAASIASGKTMAEVAATSPALNKDKLSLGELTKQAVTVAADEVFALPVGGFTKPAESPFGWHILHVTTIFPEGRKPLADVKESIEHDLKAKLGEDLLVRQSSQLQDSLGGGASLEDAAKSIGAKTQVIESVSKDGKAEKGEKAVLPISKNFLDVAFSTAEKETSRMVPSDNGVHFVLRVDAVTKEHPQPLQEVKQQVKEALQKDVDAKAVKALADQIAKDLSTGKSLEAATAGKGLAAAAFDPAGVWSYEAARIDEGKQKGKSIPFGLAEAIFSITPGKITQAAYALHEGGYVIGKLDATVSAPDVKLKEGEEALKTLRAELQKTYDKEAQTAFVGYLRHKHPVTISQSFLKAEPDSGSED